MSGFPGSQISKISPGPGQAWDLGRVGQAWAWGRWALGGLVLAGLGGSG